MNRHWEKKQDNTFTFFSEGIAVGDLTFHYNTGNKTGSFSIGEDTFIISRKSMWSSTLLITGKDEAIIATVYAEKWYAHHWVLEYGGKKYKLAIRNNPLAEYVITEGEKEILAYGLHSSDGKIQVKISGTGNTDHFIFDFLLWFLFAPVAVENMSNDISFLLLLSQ